MSVKIDEPLKGQLKEVFDQALKDLQIERAEAFKSHEEYIRKHPPKFGCERGCAEAAEIADQIRLLIRISQKIGIYPEKLDPYKYLNSGVPASQ